MIVSRPAGDCVLPANTNDRRSPGAVESRLDAFWPDAHLAVEVDGFAYHSRRPRYEGDRVRDAWLLARGIQVLRLSARQIRNDPLPTAVQLAQTLTRASRNE